MERGAAPDVHAALALRPRLAWRARAQTGRT